MSDGGEVSGFLVTRCLKKKRRMRKRVIIDVKNTGRLKGSTRAHVVLVSGEMFAFQTSAHGGALAKLSYKNSVTDHQPHV